ncbi:hypothetical protein FHG87_005499 [Trinorchestia longiramus]|nr:hypothetical protein FHG87_005499 [Trinorchestia longiramus]
MVGNATVHVHYAEQSVWINYKETVIRAGVLEINFSAVGIAVVYEDFFLSPLFFLIPEPLLNSVLGTVATQIYLGAECPLQPLPGTPERSGSERNTRAMDGRVNNSRGSTSSSSSGMGTSGGPGGGGQLSSACQAVSQHHQSLLQSVEDAARSLSLASISSEGSTESHLVEQEDIVALSTSVRGFKEALGKLRKLIQSDRECAELRDGLRVRAHEKLAEVLRTLRTILKNYCPIMHPELMTAASYLISQVNENIASADFFWHHCLLKQPAVDDFAHTSAYLDTEKVKKLVFLTRQLELSLQKQFSTNDYCFAFQSYPKCDYEQLRDFLVVPCKRKLQYLTSSIDKDQVLRETFDKVQTLQQKNVFLLVDEVQIRPTVSFSGGVLSGMAENN